MSTDETPGPAMARQWAKTGKKEPRRFVCERCGGTGQQIDGLYNRESKKYDSRSGTCDHCGGEGYLGFMEDEAR